MATHSHGNRGRIPPDPNNEPDWYQGGKQCEATNKRTGKRCRAVAAYGTHVCRKHGALGIVKSQSAEFVRRTHGRYAKLPAPLAERFDRLQDDPNKLSLDRDLTLVDTLIEEQLERIDAGPDRSLWREAKKQLGRFQVAMIGGDDRVMRESLAALIQVIDEGNSDAAARMALDRLLDRRTKMAAAEVRRISAAQEVVTAQEMLTFARLYAAIIERHVKDEATLLLIGHDMQQVLERGALTT